MQTCSFSKISSLKIVFKPKRVAKSLALVFNLLDRNAKVFFVKVLRYSKPSDLSQQANGGALACNGVFPHSFNPNMNQ